MPMIHEFIVFTNKTSSLCINFKGSCSNLFWFFSENCCGLLHNKILQIHIMRVQWVTFSYFYHNYFLKKIKEIDCTFGSSKMWPHNGYNPTARYCCHIFFRIFRLCHLSLLFSRTYNTDQSVIGKKW